MKPIRNYVKDIENENIRDIQSSIYARYIDIEGIEEINKNSKKCKDDPSTLQTRAENRRNNYFLKKERLKTDFIYSNHHSKCFIVALKKHLDSMGTKKLARELKYLNLFIKEDSLPSLLLHHVCTILGRYEKSITLTNFINQLRAVLKKNYTQAAAENNPYPLRVKQNLLFQFCKIIIHSLQDSGIVCIHKKFGPRKKKYKVNHIFISKEFKFFSLYYDYESLNMPLISKPNLFKHLGRGNNASGGFLIKEIDLITRNKKKSSITRVSDKTQFNYLLLQEEVPYKINKKYLNYILNNFSGFLSDQGFSIHKYGNDHQYNKSFEALSSRQKFLTYQAECNKITKIIETIEQACYLDNFPCFYFRMHSDPKMRMYYRGWPINPQGDSLVRNLLTPQNQRKKGTTKELDVPASGL